MITKYLSAGYPILAVRTSEPERAEKELLEELFNAIYERGTQPYNCYSWDIVNEIRQWGMVASHQLGYKAVNDKTQEDEQYPQEIFPLRWLNRQPGNTVLFVWNYHKFLVPQAINTIQTLQNYRDDWKQHQKALVMLVPEIEIVKELDKSITIIDFDMPDKAKITVVLEELADGNSIKIGDGLKETLSNAATGLTLFEAENAFALSFSHEHNSFDPKIVTEQKAQMVKKNACLEYSRFEETFANIGGLDNLKQFCSKIIKSDMSRGVMLLGIPGTGKSLFAKALGNEAGLPTLSLDFGKLFGSLVGQSEQRVREALKIIDAMSPCILFLDEIEKGLSGVQSSHQTDGGTGSRVFGSFLVWLNDHRSKVFTIATCNAISKLPPEFLRAERWDAIFFIDLPGEEERDIILNLYKSEYGVSGERPDISDWTGAEIKTMCRIAAMMRVPLKEAARYVIPLSRSMGKEVADLRNWADSRCVPASIPKNQVRTQAVRKMRPSSPQDN